MLHAISTLAGLNRLFDQTLAADAASIDSGASGFSTALDHLLIVALARTTQAVNTSNSPITVNNDTGANYDRQAISGVGTSASGGEAIAGTNLVNPGVPGSSAATGAFATIIVFIPAYAQTTAHKAAVALSGFGEDTTGSMHVSLTASRWRSTAAINRIAMTASSGNLVAGSRLTVYGIG